MTKIIEAKLIIIINRNIKCTINRKSVTMAMARVGTSYCNSEKRQFSTHVRSCWVIGRCSSLTTACHSKPVGQKYQKTAGQTKCMTTGWRACLLQQSIAGKVQWLTSVITNKWCRTWVRGTTGSNAQPKNTKHAWRCWGDKAKMRPASIRVQFVFSSPVEFILPF